MKKIKLVSPAKINLTLEIVKKFPDGFHGLRSIMIKTKNLKDELEISIDERKEGIKVICSDKSIPVDEKNICHKIARKFFEFSGRSGEITIKIKKNIPALAGLGGGSSNGAMTLLALNDYFKKPLSFKDLVKIAAEVGKDIPVFLLEEEAVYVSGKGEKLLPFKRKSQLNFLLVNPQGEISTPWAYGELDRRMWFMENKERKNISKKMLRNFKDIDKIGSSLYNDFSLLAEELFPAVKEIRNSLFSFGALGTSITGKGPTVVGIFKTKKETLKIREIMKKNYPNFFVEIG